MDTSDQLNLSIDALQKKLETTTQAKKRYRVMFIMSFLALCILLGAIYKRTVLDYASLDNVSIAPTDKPKQLKYSFDVVKPGRLDFNYGKTILTDWRSVKVGDQFTWSWGATGKTAAIVRSRKGLMPESYKKEFQF